MADGAYIAYCFGINDQYEIWVMRVDGIAARRLTLLVYEGPALGEKP